MNRLISKIWIVAIVLIIAAFGCQHMKKPFMQRIEECTSYKKIKENAFYSFDYSRFDLSAIKGYFKSGIKIDSSFTKRSDGGDVLAYTFKDDSSKFIFSLYDYSEGKLNFDLAYFETKSDIFKFNNGIKVNMTRSDFLMLWG